MLRTALISWAALLLGLAARLGDLGQPLAALHLAFAVGILPLIVAAMLHFVPVLTRSGSPSRGLAALPLGLQLSGLGLVACLQGWLPHATLALWAAVDLLLLLVLAGWIVRRLRQALGTPHPGARWYLAALIGGILALAAILGLTVWPAYWPVWRLAHVHLNTLVLVGMSAFGTLPVLLPTALGRPDPGAAPWLRRGCLPWLAGGLAVATAGLWPGLAALGGFVLLGLAGHLLWHWRSTAGGAALRADGIALALCLATAGFVLQGVVGLAHAVGWVPVDTAVPAFALGFLLPLVSAALSQLLPVWRWPGPLTPARTAMRAALAQGAAARNVCWVAGGFALALGQPTPGLLGLAAGLLFFLPALGRALRISRSTR